VRSASLSQQSVSVAARSLPRSMSAAEGTAAAELFLRLNHARQTVSFVKKQVWAAFVTYFSPPPPLRRANPLVQPDLMHRPESGREEKSPAQELVACRGCGVGKAML